MGGGYYDGDVAERARSTRDDAFTFRGATGSDPAQRECHPILNPKGTTRECVNDTPIVVAFDVTRSRGDDAKHVYAKMPMLMGQIDMRGYVPGPALSFAAIGDATVDQAPLQVGQFEADNRLDAVLESMWLEEGGGGTGQETYELAAYYYARHTNLHCLDKGRKGYFFFVADEGFYPRVSKEQVARLIGDTLRADIDSKEIFRELQERFHVYLIYPQATWEQRKEDIDAEIQKRVLEAGGMHAGVDIRASLLWNNRNDLDLHVLTPAGEHIYFGNKRGTCGGELDVDRNVRGETTKPVENTRWAKGTAPKGRYRFWVQNYAFHQAPAPTPFRVELEVNGKLEHFSGTASPHGETGTGSDVPCFEIHYDPTARPREDDPGAYAGYQDETIKAQWAAVLPPENILLIDDPKAIADIILGVLALSAGHGLDEYRTHMAERGQTSVRQTGTVAALEALASTTALARVPQALPPMRPAEKKRGGRTKRL
jgi:hypothetical protein